MSEAYVSCPKCGNRFRVTVSEEGDFTDYDSDSDLLCSDYSDTDDFIISEDGSECERKRAMSKCIRKAIEKCRRKHEHKCLKCKACQRRDRFLKRPCQSASGKYSSPVARRLLLRKIMSEHRAPSPYRPSKYTPTIRQSPHVTKKLIEEAMERRKQQLMFEKEEKVLKDLKKMEKDLKKKQACIKRKLKQQQQVVRAVSSRKCSPKKPLKPVSCDALSDSDSFVEKCIKKYERRRTEDKDAETLRNIADDLQKYSCTMKGILDSGFSTKRY